MAAAGRNGVSRIVQRKIDLQLVAWVGYWICLVILFVLLRAKSSNLVFIDETIPIKISQAMTARGNLDPNWRSADLPEELRYDQYNFYLYNVVAHFVIKVAGWLGRSGLGELRHANLLFQLLALAFAVDALRRIGAGLLALAAAGALITFAPGMVQDAGMARPESLLYLFSALFVWTLTLPLAERRRLLLAGVVLGAGIAVKLTFVSLAVMLPFLAPVRVSPGDGTGRERRDLRAWCGAWFRRGRALHDHSFRCLSARPRDACRAVLAVHIRRTRCRNMASDRRFSGLAATLSNSMGSP